jgi:hypothetical protein
VVVGLDRLTVVTGANGSGKTSFYRALRLLAEVVRDGALTGLAKEGGMRSALHAGPSGGSGVAVRLGYASDDLSYAIDLGLPQGGPFRLDPEVKAEAVWAGPVLRPATLLAERQGPRVRTIGDDGAWRTAAWRPPAHESMMAALADPAETPELYAVRQQARPVALLRLPAHRCRRRRAPPGGGDLHAGAGAGRGGPRRRAAHRGARRACRRAGGVGGGGLRRRDARPVGGRRRQLPPGAAPAGAAAAAERGGAVRRHAALPAARGRAAVAPAPGLLVLNEPESSLHPGLMPALAALVVDAPSARRWCW